MKFVTLAVLVIALVALTGVASAATITANTPYVGRPVITNVPGLAGYITGYVYDTPLTYTVTDGENTYVVPASAVKFNDDGTATVGDVTGKVVFPVDKTLHTLSGPGAIGTSILFENGKPVKTLTGGVGTTDGTTFDATFYKSLASAMGLTDQLIPKTITHNAFEGWMQ
jgi:hypothetical protein